MLAIVTFLWRPIGREAIYGAGHVNMLKRMLDEFAPPHRLVCVTDDATGIDPSVHIVEIEPRLVEAGRRYPKLMFYRRDAAELFGARRIAMMDLDCIVTGRLDRVFARTETLIAWDDPNWGSTPYNSSLVLMDAGAAPQVYNRFDPRKSEAAVIKSRFMGSDQAWLAIVMGRDLPKFTPRGDGVLSYQSHCRHPDSVKKASIVFFAGNPKPWDSSIEEPWVKQWWG
jgi:hypothetical protein